MKFVNHSSMISFPMSFTDEKLESEIKRYEAELKRVNPILSSARNSEKILRQNIDIFNKIKNDRWMVKLEKDFVFKKEHAELLKTAYQKYDDNAGFVRYYYSFDDFIERKGIDKADMSENRENELNEEFNNLLYELPFAVAFLAEKQLKQMDKNEPVKLCKSCKYSTRTSVYVNTLDCSVKNKTIGSHATICDKYEDRFEEINGERITDE